MTSADRGSPVRVVVVGGGSAGSVVAARLSASPALAVTLVEAGPDPRPVPSLLAEARRQPEILEGDDFLWKYAAERADGSVATLLGGRVTGGGSSVNHMSIVRPLPNDFERWAAIGGPQWSYARVLPVLRAIESDLDFRSDALHGGDGPIRVRRPYLPSTPVSSSARAFIDAANDIGYPVCADLNGPSPWGLCAAPYAVVDGVRQSTVVGYLDPARPRSNLTIIPDAEVTRVRVSGGRAVGVDLRTADGARRVDGDVVVLSAGAIQTPRLLLRSGIGPSAGLERVGIAPVLESPGVGANYRDHGAVNVLYETTGEVAASDGDLRLRILASSRRTVDVPDLELSVRPVPGQRTAVATVLHLEHHGSGSVDLETRDPDAVVRVRPGLVDDPRDALALEAGIGIVDELLSHPRLRPFYRGRIDPRHDADLRSFIQSTWGSYHHGVGTCRFGEDAPSVVSPDLRLHGIDGLWVADASVLPTVPRANTNLAAILVGELAARSVQAAATR